MCVKKNKNLLIMERVSPLLKRIQYQSKKFDDFTNEYEWKFEEEERALII